MNVESCARTRHVMAENLVFQPSDWLNLPAGSMNGLLRILPSHARCDRIRLCTNLAFNTTAPHKLTLALNLLIMFNCVMSHFTRVTQRSAFARRHFVAPACPSQQPRGTHGDVTHAVVWGRVEIHQLFLSSSHSSCLFFDSFLKHVILE